MPVDHRGLGTYYIGDSEPKSRSSCQSRWHIYQVFLEKLDKTEVGVSLWRSEWALWLPHWQRPNYYLRLTRALRYK